MAAKKRPVANPEFDSAVATEPKGYRSPPGTWECILKSVLEDPTFTNAEFRLLLYLATKPHDWVVSVSQLARDLQRTRYEIKTALAGLRSKGYVVVERVRSQRGRFDRHVSRLRRDLVLANEEKAKGHVSASDPAFAPVVPTSANTVSAPVSTSDTEPALVVNAEVSSTDQLDHSVVNPPAIANTVPCSDDGSVLSQKGPKGGPSGELLTTQLTTGPALGVPHQETRGAEDSSWLTPPTGPNRVTLEGRRGSLPSAAPDHGRRPDPGQQIGTEVPSCPAGVPTPSAVTRDVGGKRAAPGCGHCGRPAHASYMLSAPGHETSPHRLCQDCAALPADHGWQVTPVPVPAEEAS